METSLFSPIVPRSIEDEIIVRLRAAIIGGQFEPGDYLNETEIARQMGVSRIPVREAIKKLEQEGMVVRQPNRGVFVTSFSEQDVREVFSLRASLEAMALEWAIPHLTADDLARLRDLIERQKSAVERKDYSQLAELDMHFHEAICVKANHSRLLKAWYEQHAQCQMLLNLRFKHMADYTPDTVLDDHALLLQALETGDSRQAIALTHEISQRVSQECIVTLQRVAAQPKQPLSI